MSSASPTTKTPPTPEVPAKLSVLVVEDEALIAENLRFALEDLGYHVAATCYTYAEARRAFDTHPTDLVLLDLNLSSPDPSDDGLALAAELRMLRRPFIFLTAYNDHDTIRRAARLQPHGYLIKPTNNATLFAAIQTAFERFHTQEPAPLPLTTAESAAEAAAIAALVAPPTYFFVKLGEHTHKLFWSAVVSLEAGKNYVTLRDGTSGRSFPLRGSLAYVLDQLVPVGLRSQFVRVNRRTCLNVVFITRYDPEWVYCGTERFENTADPAELAAALRG